MMRPLRQLFRRSEPSERQPTPGQVVCHRKLDTQLDLFVGKGTARGSQLSGFERNSKVPGENRLGGGGVADVLPSTSAAGREVAVAAGGVVLLGVLTVPARAVGVVVFAHGSGSSRSSPRNARVARLLESAHLATLLFDLLTPAEADDREKVFDVQLLAGRLSAATAWLAAERGVGSLPVGYFGASTGAAAALWAASAEPRVRAIVSRGGRPDLARPQLSRVRAPTLLIVGSFDPRVLELNEEARQFMRCECRLHIVPGATHLFEEPGMLETVAALARDWFLDYLEE